MEKSRDGGSLELSGEHRSTEYRLLGLHQQGRRSPKGSGRGENLFYSTTTLQPGALEVRSKPFSPRACLFELRNVCSTGT